MSETPMNKLRELCEKWEAKADDIAKVAGFSDNVGKLRECAVELRAIMPDVKRLIEAATYAAWLYTELANREGSGADKKCAKELWEALAAYNQPVAPKEMK